MAKFDKLTLVVLLDAFRFDFIDAENTPFLYKLKDKGSYAKKLHNPGGYCERSCYATGADVSVTDNYFAMTLMPPGYKRAEYEPMFNVPPHVRVRLAMTEDQTLDFEKGSFKNWTTGETIESFYDVMREEGKTWGIEACMALGVRSWKGRTTHGSRPVQLMDKMEKGIDLALIQYSEIDQQLHYRGSGDMEGVLKNADASVEKIYEHAKTLYKQVDLIVFGDHGQTDITERVDLALEYPPFQEGWDYLYLKNSAAVQFWIFNDKVEKHILNDPILNLHGEFTKHSGNNPYNLSSRQGDVVWRAKPGTLVSPCHFHPRHDPIKAMHGFSPDIDTEKGMAIVVNSEKRKEVENCDLRDICAEICHSLGIRTPRHNQGKCFSTQQTQQETEQ